MDYLLHIIVLVGIYIALTSSLDLLAGHTGLMSLAQAAFFGLGAYATALLSVRANMSFLPSTIGALLVPALFSMPLSMSAQRLRDDYFVLATFGFQMVVFTVFNNLIAVTSGPLGIPGIPPPVIFGWTVQSQLGFVILAIILAVLTYFVVDRITTSPFGRVLHAIREDELFAVSLGRNPLRFKMIAFAVSSAIAGAAGSLYARYISYIDPTSFTVMESILVLAMVIVGGAGSRWGPLVGAILLVLLPEALRFIGLPNSVAANLRAIVYGVLLVAMVMMRPRGLVGRYGFRRY